jgi:hypothetical protein
VLHEPPFPNSPTIRRGAEGSSICFIYSSIYNSQQPSGSTVAYSCDHHGSCCPQISHIMALAAHKYRSCRPSRTPLPLLYACIPIVFIHVNSTSSDQNIP